MYTREVLQGLNGVALSRAALEFVAFYAPVGYHEGRGDNVDLDYLASVANNLFQQVEDGVDPETVEYTENEVRTACENVRYNQIYF